MGDCFCFQLNLEKKCTPSQETHSLPAVAFLTPMVPGLLYYTISSKQHTKHRANTVSTQNASICIEPIASKKFKFC